MFLYVKLNKEVNRCKIKRMNSLTSSIRKNPLRTGVDQPRGNLLNDERSGTIGGEGGGSTPGNFWWGGAARFSTLLFAPALMTMLGE